ncbi:MAG: fused MFS/spermidine synthase [Actinomycetota bacterium]
MVRSVEDALAAAVPEPSTADRSLRNGRSEAALIVVAALASFLAAWLIFAVQPMATRMVLPRLGGSAAVWNTALVFFQVGLLAGYALTHFTTTRLKPRTQVAVHLGLVAVAALLLPLDISDRWAPPESGSPGLWLIAVFAMTIGLPYLALSAISPLVQRWFSLSNHPRAADPYFLYAASNAGSLLGLLTYPFVVEPLWSLDEQSRVWTVGYALFALAIIALVLRVRPDRVRADHTAATPLEHEDAREDIADQRTLWRQRLTWIGWAFIPSSLMIGVTNHVTTDVASIPLFWVIPLAIFLATYIAAFGARRLPLTIIDLAVLAIAAATAISLVEDAEKRISIALHLSLLAAVALAFHGRLARSRPVSSRLTEFFLCTSVGGVLGGVFNALVAPIIFNQIIEYGLMIAVAGMLVARDVVQSREVSLARLAPGAVVAGLAALSDVSFFRNLAILTVVVIILAVRNRPILAGLTIAMIVAAGTIDSALEPLHADRSFYGPFEVHDTNGTRTVQHGTTVHGGQLLDPALRNEPAIYYTRTGGIGRVFEAYADDPRLGEIGILGLGAGGLAAYSEPDRHITFFEIDSKIRDLAENTKYFTFLHDAPGPVDVTLGDGRLSLEQSDTRFGMLVMDAFSSDSVPVHLLTEEAFTTYLDRLAPDGILVVHVSNRYIDLEPVVAAVAEDLGLHTAIMTNDRITAEDRRFKKAPSKYIVIGESAEALAPLNDVADWRPAERQSGVDAWTDDHSDLISVLEL